MKNLTLFCAGLISFGAQLSFADTSPESYPCKQEVETKALLDSHLTGTKVFGSYPKEEIQALENGTTQQATVIKVSHTPKPDSQAAKNNFPSVTTKFDAVFKFENGKCSVWSLQSVKDE